jgi:ribosome biogenesis protein ENP2
MAEDANDPNAYSSMKAGAVYDNYKFLTMSQLQTLNIDHLIGKSSLLRPYMHGYFVSQKLYEEASLISNPTFWEEQRAKKIQQKIEQERESRIRGRKKVKVKQNRQLAERILEQEEKNERRKARRALAKGGEEEPAVDGETAEQPARKTLLNDARFANLFDDEDFVIDENSKEFASLNPVRKEDYKIPKGLTAVDQEMLDQEESSQHSGKDGSDSSFESESEPEVELRQQRNLKPVEKRPPKTSNGVRQPVMSMTNSKARRVGFSKSRSFNSRLAKMKDRPLKTASKVGNMVGEKQVTFTPHVKQKRREEPDGSGRVARKDRRSASGNVFRGM